MPKLSADSLQKRLKCPYCDKTFRTRQGLSGHIKFKHATPEADSTEEYTQKMLRLVEKGKLLRQLLNDLPVHYKEQGDEIIYRWSLIMQYFHRLNIEVNDKDFKSFFISNFGISNAISKQSMEAVSEALNLLKGKI